MNKDKMTVLGETVAEEIAKLPEGPSTARVLYARASARIRATLYKTPHGGECPEANCAQIESILKDARAAKSGKKSSGGKSAVEKKAAAAKKKAADKKRRNR